MKEGEYHDEDASYDKALYYYFYLDSVVLFNVGYILDVDKRTPDRTISSNPARNLKGTNFFTNIWLIYNKWIQKSKNFPLP